MSSSDNIATQRRGNVRDVESSERDNNREGDRRRDFRLRMHNLWGWIVFIIPIIFIWVYGQFLQVMRPFIDWWTENSNNVMALMNFLGYASTVITLKQLEHVTPTIFIIIAIASVFALVFNLWAFTNVEHVREVWWLHIYLGNFVDWLANATMLLLGIFVGRWTETSWMSIIFFCGLSIWFLTALYLVRPPTDFGVLVFLVTCTLNQALRFHGTESDIIFVYWAVSVVLLGIKTIINPHPAAPVNVVVPTRQVEG